MNPNRGHGNGPCRQSGVHPAERVKVRVASADNDLVTRARLVLPFAAALVGLWLPAGAGAVEDPLRDPLAPAPGKYMRLSNESTLSRWAYTNLAVRVRRSPSNRSRTVSRLRFNTEDRYPERYLALRAYTDAKGAGWVQIRLLGRPNGRTGWVPREGLGEFHVVRTRLVLDRRRLRLTLFKRGKAIFRVPVGIGKRSTPTPAGNYYIRERLPGFGNPVYGPVAFGTSAYSSLSEWPGGGVIGIHGTNQPELLPGRPSNGCVRMTNRNILRLKRLLPIGTPFKIR